MHVCGADPPPPQVCDRMKKLLPFSPSLFLCLLHSFPSTPSVTPAVSSCGAPPQPPSAVTLLGRPPAVHAVGLTPVSQSLARSVGRLDGAETESKTDGRTDR